MYQKVIVASEVARVGLDLPGVSLQVLDTDEATGGMLVLTHLEPGAEIPAHWHSVADETVYVISGDFVEQGTAYGPGTVFVGKAGTSHGPHRSVQGCSVLTRFSAALDFHGEVPGPLD